MKKKMLLFVVSILLVTVLGVYLTGCKKPIIPDDGAVMNYSGYQKKPDSKIPIAEAINFKSDSPLAVYEKAAKNTDELAAKSSFIITNTNITGAQEEGNAIRKLVVKMRSSYFTAKDATGSFTQIVSGPQEIILPGLDVTTIAAQFGYVTQTFNVGGTTYRRAHTGLFPGPVFEQGDEGINYPAGAYSKNWSKKWKQEATEAFAANGGIYAASEKIIDTVTGKEVSVSHPKGDPSETYVTGPNQYQIDEATLDMGKCTMVQDASKEFWNVNLVFKTGESLYNRPASSEKFRSIIDQACRGAAGMLVNDINSAPGIEVKSLYYDSLSVKIQVWNNGLMKRLNRNERVELQAKALGSKGKGYADNDATEVFSYDPVDSNISTYMTKFEVK